MNLRVIPLAARLQDFLRQLVLQRHNRTKTA
jgi:hypothetical protein